MLKAVPAQGWLITGVVGRACSLSISGYGRGRGSGVNVKDDRRAATMPDLAVLTPPHQRDRGHRPGRGAGLPVSVGVVLVQSLPDGHVVLPLTQAAHLGVLGDHTRRSPSSSSTTTTTLARRRCVRCAEAFPCRPWKIPEDLDRGFARSAETRACFTHQELERHLHPKRRVMAITARNWTTSRTRSDNVRALTPPSGGVVVSDHLLDEFP